MVDTEAFEMDDTQSYASAPNSSLLSAQARECST
jgi:hypothetical protein